MQPLRPPKPGKEKTRDGAFCRAPPFPQEPALRRYASSSPRNDRTIERPSLAEQPAAGVLRFRFGGAAPLRDALSSRCRCEAHVSCGQAIPNRAPHRTNARSRHRPRIRRAPSVPTQTRRIPAPRYGESARHFDQTPQQRCGNGVPRRMDTVRSYISMILIYCEPSNRFLGHSATNRS